VVAIVGAAVLWLVAAVLASTAGLLLVAGALGTTVGLLLARAAVPVDTAKRPTPRRTVVRLAVALAVGAVMVADVLTWTYARREGGTLALLDYLWTTFELLVPVEAIVAAVTAWWGASAGPVQR
jgi:hypothetical protein